MNPVLLNTHQGSPLSKATLFLAKSLWVDETLPNANVLKKNLSVPQKAVQNTGLILGNLGLIWSAGSLIIKSLRGLFSGNSIPEFLQNSWKEIAGFVASGIFYGLTYTGFKALKIVNLQEKLCRDVILPAISKGLSERFKALEASILKFAQQDKNNSEVLNILDNILNQGIEQPTDSLKESLSLQVIVYNDNLCLETESGSNLGVRNKGFEYGLRIYKSTEMNSFEDCLFKDSKIAVISREIGVDNSTWQESYVFTGNLFDLIKTHSDAPNILRDRSPHYLALKASNNQLVKEAENKTGTLKINKEAYG